MGLEKENTFALLNEQKRSSSLVMRLIKEPRRMPLKTSVKYFPLLNSVDPLQQSGKTFPAPVYNTAPSCYNTG